jgi:hypothetical protein
MTVVVLPSLGTALVTIRVLGGVSNEHIPMLVRNDRYDSEIFD